MFSAITDDDIVKVEQLLLPAGEQFDAQRRDIIKCLNSADVNACPGSGKTTVMLAKLLLLNGQLPLQDNRGICVLTHTNVAINEIREKLGKADASLFGYPNHFGTIQSFVNKYLALPGYSFLFPGKRPAIIDQEWHDNYIAKRYSLWPNCAGKMWLSRQHEPAALLASFKFNAGFDRVLRGVNGEPVFKNPGAASGHILALKKDIFERGILSYDDAYVLAEYYISKCPRIIALVRQRFAFLIIDEMQDTNEYQLSLLNRLFDGNVTIVQRIGDQNQAIYNKVASEVYWQTAAQVLPLTGSKRFSPAIAAAIDKICVTPCNMQGNNQVAAIAPRLIIYHPNKIALVLGHFANITIEQDIANLSQRPVKAVGWVKEQPAAGRPGINSYWPGYAATNKAVKSELRYLAEYFEKADVESIRKKGTRYYWDKAILALLKILRLADIKHPSGSHYSPVSLTAKIKQHPQLYELMRQQLLGWIKAIEKGEAVIAGIRQFIIQQFYPAFQVQQNNDLITFVLTNPPVANAAPAPQIQTGVNLFTHTYNGVNHAHNGKTASIEMNTIHSVKGETHAATLYLETFYKAKDIRRIIRYFKIGNGAAIAANQPIMRDTLKMAYVAMSRPTHLLCVALSSENMTQQDFQQLGQAGWHVDTILNTP